MDVIFDKLFSSSKQYETSLIRKFSGSPSFSHSNSLFQNMPIEYQQQILEESLFSSDFKKTAPNKLSVSSLLSHFRTYNHDHFPKISPCADLMQEYHRLFSSPLNMVVDFNSDFRHLWGTVSSKSMEKTCDLIDLKSDVSHNFVVSIKDTAMPDKTTHLNLTVSKTMLKPLPLKNHQENCNLDQQMAHRKTKELQKRSKKRRRRQKKCNSSSADNVLNHKFKVNCEVKESSKNPTDDSEKIKKDNCDIICDLTVSCDSKSVQIVLPNISSFVVTIESDDGDSDWDAVSENDIAVNDSEFHFSGLFVANFTASNMCSPVQKHESESMYDKELNLMKKRLEKVNKDWNEYVKHSKAKETSIKLVSFAPDEELTEIYPVEIYERKGEWEIYATERLRFKKRINEVEKILSPYLTINHREKVYFNLYEAAL